MGADEGARQGSDRGSEFHVVLCYQCLAWSGLFNLYQVAIEVEDDAVVRQVLPRYEEEPTLLALCNAAG